MSTDAEPRERRATIARILRVHRVGRQADLVRLLRKEGVVATQSSVSRDLRHLGVLKAGDRYLLPSEATPAPDRLDHIAHFVREIRPAGPTLTVVKTTVGAAQSVAAAIDRERWPELVGTISGDDTIFIATEGARQQRRVLGRLRSAFRA
jgi:transcriptional regulator of arginine metabolism